MTRHNPEKKAWKGRSHKKGGKRVRELKAKADFTELKTVREWLYDYFSMIEDTEMNRILADVATREVESYATARAHVNTRIDNWKSWLDGTRPTPSFIYEPKAYLEWCAVRGKELPADLKAELEERAAREV